MSPGERNVTIGRDAHGNVIVTGDNNTLYVFPGVTKLPADLVIKLRQGLVELDSLAEAVPLPTMTLTITFADAGREQWRVIAAGAAVPVAAASLVPAPWIS